MTNADRIREMDDEELADFLERITTVCNRGRCYDCEPYNHETKCCNIYSWLTQEVANEER